MIEITQTLHAPQTAVTFVNDKSQSSLLESSHFIWTVAIILSLATHAVFLFHKNNLHKAVPAMVTQETITHVRFANISPPPITVVEPDITPEIKPPEPVINQPKVEEQIVEKQKPDPIIKPKAIKKNKPPKPKKKKPIPKPPKKKVAVKKPPVKAQKTPVKPQPTLHVSKPQVNKEVKTSPLVSNADQRLIAQTRKSYFALLMRHIEVHKNYPRVARKRKIEGKIMVSFSLFSNGSIKNLKINGKRSILEKASKNAISNSLPMPMPPKSLSLPMDIKFTMDYFLN